MKRFNRDSLKKYLSILILLLSSVFISKLLFIYSDQILPSLQILSGISMIFSAIFYVIYFYLRAISWCFAAKSLGGKLSVRDSISVWLLGELGRYLPGNVWSFAGRIVLAERKKMPKTLTLLSLAVEILILVSTTLILSLPALINIPLPLSSLKILIILLLILVVLLALIVGFKNKLKAKVTLLLSTNKIAKLLNSLTNLPDKLFLSNNFYISVFFQFVSWICFGLGTYFLANNFTNVSFWLLASISILAWLIGYLILITPMGLGVRETAIILLLAHLTNYEQAVIIALTSRLLMVVVETVNVLTWMIVVQRKNTLSLFKKITHYWDVIILSVLIVIYISIFCSLSILRHDAFASNFDLANVDQTIWNTIHGHFFMLTSGMGNISRLSIHSDFILILLSPLYLIWNNVRTLLIAQSVFLGLGAIPVYLLSRKVLNNKLISVILAAVFLLNPGMQWVNVYDFHGVALAIPLLLITFYFTFTKNWKWYWLFFFLALITKEEISLFLATMGLFSAIFWGNRKTGILSSIIGITWFLAMIFLVIPHFNANGQHWAFNEWYGQIKSDIDQYNFPGLFNLVKTDSTYPNTIGYYVLLLKPFGFLPILGLPWLLMALPELLINILSTNPQMQSTTLHYDSGIIPGLIIGTIFGLKYLKMALSWILWKLAHNSKSITLATIPLVLIGLVLLIYSVRVDYHYGPLPISPSCWCLTYQVDNDDQNFEKVLQSIPENAVISASGEVRPHLTHRLYAYSLPEIPPNVNYIAIIDQNRIVGNYNPHPFEVSLIAKLKSDPQYTLKSQLGHFYLFKKN